MEFWFNKFYFQYFNDTALLLICIVSIEKTVIIFNSVSLHTSFIWHFKKFLFITDFEKFGYDAHLCSFSDVYLYADCDGRLSHFLNLWVYSYHHIGKYFSHYFFKYIFCPYVFLLSYRDACVLGHFKCLRTHW